MPSPNHIHRISKPTMSTQPSGDEKKKESKSITSFASKMKVKMFGKKKEKEKEKDKDRSTQPAKLVSLSDYFDVPPVLKKCLDFLSQDKYLQMDCYAPTFSQTEVQKIQAMFDQNDLDNVSLSTLNPNDLSGYLRRWFRNLTDPLFSYDLYDKWIAVQAIDEIEEQIEQIRSLSQLLNTAHYLSMQALFRYFKRLVKFSSLNGITSTSIGFLWQPNLIKNETDETIESLKLNNNGTLTGNLVSIIIEHFDQIFTEDYFPSPLMSTDILQPESPRHSPIASNPLSGSNDSQDITSSPENESILSHTSEQEVTSSTKSTESLDNGSKDLSPIVIPSNNTNMKGHTSVPVTPSLFSPVNSKPNQFPSSSTPTTPNNVPLKGQLVVINGYTHGYALCDYLDQTEGRLNFVKDEKVWVTKKHDDGWWEGWKRGKRGFFPSSYIAEFKV